MHKISKRILSGVIISLMSAAAIVPDSIDFFNSNHRSAAKSVLSPRITLGHEAIRAVIQMRSGRQADGLQMTSFSKTVEFSSAFGDDNTVYARLESLEKKYGPELLKRNKIRPFTKHYADAPEQYPDLFYSLTAGRSQSVLCEEGAFFCNYFTLMDLYTSRAVIIHTSNFEDSDGAAVDNYAFTKECLAKALEMLGVGSLGQEYRANAIIGGIFVPQPGGDYYNGLAFSVAALLDKVARNEFGLQNITQDINPWWGRNTQIKFLPDEKLALSVDDKGEIRRAVRFNAPSNANAGDAGFISGLESFSIINDLLMEANAIVKHWPVAKVATGAVLAENAKPVIAVNSIGIHRHAEINLILEALAQSIEQSAYPEEEKEEMRGQLLCLEWQVTIGKLNRENSEAMENLLDLHRKLGKPFKGATIYSTLRPCADCIYAAGKLGVSQIVYISDHADREFTRKSIAAARDLGLKVTQAEPPAGGRQVEPNELFFKLVREKRADLEALSEVIKRCFTAYLSDLSPETLTKDELESRQEEFLKRIAPAFKGFSAESDLEVMKYEIILRVSGLIKNISLRKEILNGYGIDPEELLFMLLTPEHVLINQAV